MNRLKLLLLCFLGTSCALKVMTFNLFEGGTQVIDGIQKIADQINHVNPDIVALQEISNENDYKKLVHSLGNGWEGVMHCNKISADYVGFVGVVTRHKILNIYEQVLAGFNVRIQLKESGKEISFWTMHLLDTSYAPLIVYHNKGQKTLEQILESDNKKNGRIDNIVELVKHPEFVQQIKNSDNTPVIVAGYFGTPSHLDWVEETKSRHHNWVIDFKATKILSSAAGMTDSYREVHPNPLADPGFTWTVYQTHNDVVVPKDRIDYIFYRGSLKPTSSYTFSGKDQIVGGKPWKTNKWPSDHWAVITDFEFTCPKNENKPSFFISGEYSTRTYAPVNKCPMKIIH